MRDRDSEAAPDLKELPVAADGAGARLDQWLTAALGPDVSRSRVQALIRDGAVSLDGRAVTQSRRKVAAGETYVFALPEPDAPEPRGEAIALDILFEDEALIVVDKPAGMVVHPGAGVATGTLVNALIHHCGDSLSGIGGVRRPGIVHRLDRDTSGVMVVAKTDKAHRALSAAFADHGRAGDLERAYAAIVWGAPRRANGTIDAALGRSTKDRTRRAVIRTDRPDARRAVTHYSLVESFGGGEPVASLLECRLETGRTHQIRVHLAHIGHPLVGDGTYGSAHATKANLLPPALRAKVAAFHRQALHARLLAFRHPDTDALLRFETEPPADMMELLAGLGDWKD